MRVKRNLDLANEILQELNSKNRTKDIAIPRRKSLLKKVANRKVSPATRKFLAKLEDERFKDFNKTDWLLYFQKRYKEANGIGYQILGQQMYYKHHAIINSLMKNYEPNDIRSMIDFLFTSGQDMFPLNKITIYHLSSGFLPSVYQNTQLWIIGEYKTDAEIYQEKATKRKLPKRKREWDASKDSNNDDEIVL